MVPSVQRREVWLTPTTRVPCSNAAKTRNPLKCTGVPQTRQQISAVSKPTFTILSEHVEEALLFNTFFPIVDTCLNSEDVARQSCAMVPRWRFFLCGIMVDIQSATDEVRRGKKEERSTNDRMKIYIVSQKTSHLYNLGNQNVYYFSHLT